MKTAVIAVAALLAMPAFGQSKKYDFSLDLHKQPVARGMDLVDGAVVCRSFDDAMWLTGWINKARHARRSLSRELRKQGELINGYDYGAEPRPSDYGCVIVPAGTPLEVEQGNYVPVVSGVLPNGKKFQGVTIPNMIAR
jgi:prophage tail gpP-like protein